MASGQIKKGFFFYFGMFTLLLVTVFLICLVIMIFNPGTSVLWMKYFTGNETYIVEKTSDGNDINWDNVSDIVVSAPSFAKVTVQRTQQTNVGGSKKSDTGIYIKNNAKGFQGASGAVKFGYETTLVNGKLKITLKEPNGFLFFSKDIEVIIHTSTFDRQKSLNGKNLVILGGSGDVTIGKAVNTNDQPVILKSLYVSTTSGNVFLERNFDSSSSEALNGQISEEDTGKNGLKPLYVSTVSGDIYASQKVDNENGIKLKTDSTFKTDSGNIRLGRVNAEAKTVYIECKKGTIVSSYMKAYTVSIKCTHGNYNIGKVEGNLSFGESLETIISPNINVGEVTGNFTLGESENSSPDINITKVGGEVSVHGNEGTLTINEIGGKIDIESNKMSVNVKLAENNTSQISIIVNGSASTRLGLRGEIGNTRTSSNAIQVTTHGSLTIDFTLEAKFRAGTYKYDADVLEDNKGERLDSQSSIIQINGYVWTGESKSDLQRNYDGDENITIITSATGNGSVTFNLVNEI